MNELGDFLQKRIKAKGWSANETARRAGISSGGISTLLRGLAKPRVDTLKALAKVLDVEESRLLYLAGMLDELPTGNFDQSAAYIARRITDLPPRYRQVAIDALAAQLDAIYTLYEEDRGPTTQLEVLEMGAKR